MVYNNTLNATHYSIYTNGLGNWNGTKIYNNVLLQAPNYYKGLRGAVAVGNVSSATSPAVGAGKVTAGASGVVTTPPPVVTPPVVPPVTPPVVPPVKPPVKPPVVPPVIPPVVPPVVPPVTTPKSPKATGTIQAVNYTDHYKVKGDTFGGIGYAYNNDWVSYKLDFAKGVSKLTIDVASVHSASIIEIHVGSPSGKLVGTLNVAKTGHWNTYTAQSTAVAGLTGEQTVYLVFKGKPGVANIKWLKFS